MKADADENNECVKYSANLTYILDVHIKKLERKKRKREVYAEAKRGRERRKTKTYSTVQITYDRR